MVIRCCYLRDLLARRYSVFAHRTVLCARVCGERTGPTCARPVCKQRSVCVRVHIRLTHPTTGTNYNATVKNCCRPNGRRLYSCVHICANCSRWSPPTMVIWIFNANMLCVHLSAGHKLDGVFCCSTFVCSYSHWKTCRVCDLRNMNLFIQKMWD
jgi:hypothetical protein